MMLLASSLFHLTSSKYLISSLPSFSFHPQLKNNSTKGCVLLPLNCTPRDDISDPDKLPFSSSSTSRPPAVALANSTYNWCALIGGLGFLDTTYLSYLNLTGSDPFCPVAASGSCTDVLTSDYAAVFEATTTALSLLKLNCLRSDHHDLDNSAGMDSKIKYQ